MTAILGAIQSHYIQHLPSEMPTKAAQGFIVTAAISLLAGCSANVALLGGAIAASATIIEAVTRPIIRAIFPNHSTIASCIQVYIPNTIALGVASALTPWIGVSYKMTSALLSIFAWITLNDRFYERNVAMAGIL